MVSADNLNFDVLELIFAYLSGNDLVAVSHVSRSFLAGVIPKLYRRLFLNLHQSKRESILAPFAVVRRHPQLASHVRQIDITVLPGVKPALRPNETQDCIRVLELCTNLTSFMCSPSPIQGFISSLRKLDSLENLRINAHLAAERTEMLVQLERIKSLTLDFASWHVIVALPRWAAEKLAPTLTTLTIYMTSDLNETTLNSTLSHLPRLEGLHIISCGKVDHVVVFKSIVHTPLLKSLSFTTWESPRSVDSIPPLLMPRLRHITIDTRSTMTATSVPDLWTSTFVMIKSWTTPLTSLTLKLSERLALGDHFVQDVLDTHGRTLEVLKFINCIVSPECLMRACKSCKRLHVLGITIPPRKDFLFFSTALAGFTVLHTLIDIPLYNNTPASHGPQQALNKSNIEKLMCAVPTLRTIKTGKRLWVGCDTKNGLQVTLERGGNDNMIHWFMPSQ